MPAPHPRPSRYGPSLRVRLSSAQAEQVKTFAAEVELSLSSTLRLLVTAGLRRPIGGPGEFDTGQVALAALVAAEHSRLLLEHVLPTARVSAIDLAAAAAVAAGERLRSAAREDDQW